MRHDHSGRGGAASATGWQLRRPDTRALLLAALLDGPAHGYALMRRLEEYAAGRWRPSPGSVYPLLQQLDDEALIRLSDRADDDGRKVYALTSAGRSKADRALLAALSASDVDTTDRAQLRGEIKALHLATKQIGIAGESGHIEQATAIVREARRALYRLLAEQ